MFNGPMEASHCLVALLGLVALYRTRAVDQEEKACVRPSPLGLADSQIPDSFLSASSEHAQYPARHGRLDGHGAWCAGALDTDQWLQVDLGELKEVMALSVQGRLNGSWVTSFFVQFSSDMVTWYCYGHQQGSKLFAGNQNAHTWIVHVLHPHPVLARFVRINPQSWHASICVRSEVYGCPVSLNETYAAGIPTQGRCYEAAATAAAPEAKLIET